MKLPPPRIALLVLLPLLFAAIWAASFYEIGRNRREAIRDAEAATTFQARAFAENTQSTIKRINEVLLDLRDDWNGDWGRFAAMVKARQEHIGDITFQIGIIDANGYLAYSNLAPSKEKVYLGDREHFRVHAESGIDRLFISKPLKGKVSGKWAIQFTRPIRTGGTFKGVIVASVSPESFVAFHHTLNLSEMSATSIARDSGEIIARYPNGDELLGKVVTWPYSDVRAPLAGNFTRIAQLDGIERVFGYYKLPEYGLTFFVAESTAHLLQPSEGYRQTVLAYATVFSAVLLLFAVLLYRSLAARDRVRDQLRESESQQRRLSTAVAQSNASVVMTDAEGRIEFVNSSFVRITGYTPEEALGQNPRILKSGLNKPETYEELWATITAGKPWKGELQNRALPVNPTVK
jgi:PAS domain-containing protein